MNPLAIFQDLVGNYIFLFTFPIKTLLTNKSPEVLSGKSESLLRGQDGNAVKGTPWPGSILLLVLWKHSLPYLPHHLVAIAIRPEWYV